MTNKKFNSYKDILGLFVLWGIVAVLLYSIYFAHGFTLDTPIVYGGGDETSYMAEVKMMLDGNSWVKSDMLGAPFGTDRSAVLSYYLFNDVHLLSFLFVKLTQNAVIATNLTFFTLFFIISGVTYAVLKSRRLISWIAILGSLLFTFQSYIFIRSTPHLMLSAYYTIPLIFLLCLWIYEDNKFLKIEKGMFHYRRNILGLIFSILIANNGTGYYPVFACFFIFLTGIFVAIDKNKIKGIIPSIVQCFEIVFFMVVSVSGSIIAKLSGNVASNNVGRSMVDAERYGLKITHLFFPYKSTGMTGVDDIINQYAQIEEYRYEVSEYLGYIGIAGFIILLLFLFLKVKNESKYSELALISRLNICAILFGTVGGFGTLLFLFVTKVVRCTNRLSIFIAFFSIYSVCVLVCSLTDGIKKKLNNKYKSIILVVVISIGIIVTSLSIHSQILNPTDYNEVKRLYREDKNYFNDIEKSIPQESMVYQLPYHSYPDGGIRNNMLPNQLFLPYIHTESIKWSYGTITGEKSQKWNEYVASFEIKKFLESLCFMDFSGLYIDVDAYLDTDIEALKKALQMEIGKQPFTNQDGSKLFYDLQKYKAELNAQYTEKEWKQKINTARDYGQ